jgi:hypothetical protein
MKINGRPLIYMWSVAEGLGFVNHVGNLAPLIQSLRTWTKQVTGGVEPFIIVDSSWVILDPAVGAWVDGVNNWFTPPSGSSTRSHIGFSGTFTTQIIAPGFYFDLLGPEYMFVDRSSFASALANSSYANVTLIEGITDVEENAGLYRGATESYPYCGPMDQRPAGQAWAFPNQYLNMVRETGNPGLRYAEFQAEAADTAVSFNATGSGLYRRAADKLDIQYTSANQSNWSVRLDAGESLTFKSIQLDTGNYRLHVRYAAAAPVSVRLWTDGTLRTTATLPATGSLDTYNLAYDSTLFLMYLAKRDIKLEVVTGDARIDLWGLGVP